MSRMDKQKLIDAGIEYEAGLKRFAGNTKLYESYLIQFVTDLHYQRMYQAIKEQKVQEAFEESHALKGMVGTLGMKKLAEGLQELIRQLYAGEIDRCDGLLKSVEKEYKRMVEAIIQS